MPRLSIIIPVVGNLSCLEDTLLSVLENRPADCEILVVLDEPYGDPYALSGEVRFLEASRGAGYVESANLGLAASQAPLVHVLTSGCQVQEGWADRAIVHFADPSVATVIPLVLAAGEPARVLAAGMGYGAGGGVSVLGRGRSVAAAKFRHPPVAALPLAAFYRKTALERVGLFSQEVGDWLASIDLGLALERSGFRAVLEPGCRVVAACPAVRTPGAFRNALELERLFWRWGPRRGWTRSLALHGASLLAESLWGLVTLRLPAVWAGRLIGLCRIGSHRRQLRRLEHLGQLCPAPSPVAGTPHFRRIGSCEKQSRRIGSPAGL